MSSKHRYCENSDCAHLCLQDFSNSEMRDVVCQYADLFLVCMFLDIPDPDEQTNK